MDQTFLVAGVDEAGRGPLFGSVFAAAVILDENKPIHGLRDSKELTPKKREYLFNIILENAFDYAIAKATALEVDELNILQATMLAMQRAVSKLSYEPNEILVDGNVAPKFKLSARVIAVIKGDSIHANISAASILAKVSRDKEMEELAAIYPEYGFDQHKGYPTKKHLEALAKYGPIKGLHRNSYKPVRDCLQS